MAELPILQRQVSAQPGGNVEVQTGIENYAAATNNLSAIGAKVAQSASNQMAQILGTQMGKKPSGDLMPPITEFDKSLQDSYHTQAQATLSLQGQKLLDDAHIQISKANRLTPDLIARTDKQLQLGLSKIADQAPTAIKTDLEKSFEFQRMSNVTHYNERMITEQREDQKNNLINSLDLNLKNILAAGTAGNTALAQQLVNSTKSMSDNGHSNRYLTTEQRRLYQENAEQAAINGNVISLAMQAQQQNKYPEFIANYVKNKPAGITHEQWLASAQAASEQIGIIQNLQTQNENLKSIEFKNNVLQDVTSAGNDLIHHQSEVSPLKFQEDKEFYLRALNKHQNDTALSDTLIHNWGNKEVYARTSDETKNKAFDTQVKNNMINAQKQGKPLGYSEAEAQVAANAAGPVPTMIKLLNSKLASPIPQNIEDAGKSIDYMNQMNKGSNLAGITDQSLSMLNKYQALRETGMNGMDAGQMAYDAVYNQTSDQKKITNENWNNIDRTSIQPSGKLNYYSSLAGFNSDKLVDPQGFTEQAESLLETYYKTTGGDIETAKKMTADALKQSYGDTYINGKAQTVFFPLENIVGLPSESSGLIQDDIIDQVNQKLAPIKESFDKGKSQYYWEIEPRTSPEGLSKKTQKIQNDLLSRGYTKDSLAYKYANSPANNANAEGDVMVIHKHWKDGTRETFPLIVKADPWLVKLNNSNKPYAGSWDIVLGTKNGWKPLQGVNAMMGDTIHYNPDIKKIKTNYAKLFLGSK